MAYIGYYKNVVPGALCKTIMNCDYNFQPSTYANNKGKLREIRALLPKYIKISSVSKYKIKSPQENGNSFKENSLN